MQFSVLATGAGGQPGAAAFGAVPAGLLVIGSGLALPQPLARVPENTLLYGVGVLRSAFGVFGIDEGLGYPWPGEDLARVALIVGFALVSLGGAACHVAQAASSVRHESPPRSPASCGDSSWKTRALRSPSSSRLASSWSLEWQRVEAPAPGHA